MWDWIKIFLGGSLIVGFFILLAYAVILDEREFQEYIQKNGCIRTPDTRTEFSHMNMVHIDKDTMIPVPEYVTRRRWKCEEGGDIWR